MMSRKAMQRAEECSTTKAGGESRSGEMEAGEGEWLGGYVEEIVQKGQLSADGGAEEGSKELVMMMRLRMPIAWSSFRRALGNGERNWACAQDRRIATWRGRCC